MDEKGFSVVISDLVKASSIFHNASQEYQTHMPNGGRFVRASGGDPQLDKIIDVSLGTIEEMHTILVQALEQHSLKLKLTAEKLDEKEAANTQNINEVIQQMMKEPPPALNDEPSF